MEGIDAFGGLRVFAQKRVLAFAAMVAFLGFQGAQNASAQPATGSILGAVRDPSGAAVTGAQITIRSLTNNRSQTATSDSAGSYKVQNLSAGSYEITAAKYGFEDAKARLSTDARRPVRLDLKLKLAELADAASSQPVMAPDESKKLEALEQRIEQLEAELKNTARSPSAETTEHSPLLATVTKDPTQIPILPSTSSKPEDRKTMAANTPPPTQAPSVVAPQASNQSQAAAAPAVDLQTPFAYGDFTWLNGTPRNKDTVLDTKFFTPEVRFDTNYMEDFNQPIDHTIVGATESFRSGEVQIEQASVGGDFHWQNVRGRILFMMGLFATTTPRNDASSATGLIRETPAGRPVGPAERLQVRFGSLRRISLQRQSRTQRRRRNFRFVHRPVQLLQFR